MPEQDPPEAVGTPSGTPAVSGSSSGEIPPFPVPDHTLIRRIGRGAYGEVWLARNALGTWRAVKFVRRSSFDDDRPFEREFAGIQRFEPISRSHESQLNMLHVGRAEDGFYYVMELADDMGRGQEIDEATYTPRNLRSELHIRGRLPASECLRIGLALTTALGHLHRHGLVHRDIKPSNIVFVNGIPKLADIGLVARAEATMSFVGTEGFLPPEGPGTRQADIYSLGKVLYEISTGHDRQQFPELPTNIVELPDRGELSELNEVLLRACAPDVKQRYESAAEMHADLALLQSGKSVSRMRAVERRLQFVARAGAVVTGIALLAGAAFFYQQIQTREARRLANENQVLAADKAKLADENRQRIVRLDIANGVRLLDDNDPSAALLWFADALPLVTNNPAVEEIHRIRIQQTLEQMPRLLQLFSDESSLLASAFSPDGLRLATVTRFARDKSKLTVRDVQTGEVLWELQETKDLRQVRFARDGRLLFLWSSDDQGRVWQNTLTAELQVARIVEVQTGKAVFEQLNSNLLFSVFSPDDRWLAVALTNHVIQLLDTRDGHMVVEMQGHTNAITTLAFSEDGSLLASGSRDGTARIWRLPGGDPLEAALAHEQQVRRVALSADGRHLATATWESDQPNESQIQIWDCQAGKKVGETITQTGVVRALFFSPKGNGFFLGGPEDGVRVWEVGDGLNQRQTLKFPIVRCWDFSPDGRTLALGTDVGFVSIWSTETWERLFPPVRHTGWVESVHFSPDGTRLLTTSDDGTAKVWSLTRSTESARLTLSPNIGGFDGWSTHGLIPIGMEDGSVHLIDPDRLADIKTLTPRQTNVPMDGLTSGTTGRFWAMGEPQSDVKTPGRLTLWKRQDGVFSWQEITLPELEGLRQFNADDSRLASVRLLGSDRIIHIWRTSDGSLERSIPVPDFLQFMRWEILLRPFDLGFRTLLSYGVDPAGNGYVQAFDLASGQFTGKPFAVKEFGGGDRITQMRLSPDGTRLASVGHDQKGTILDLQTGKLAVPQFKHGGSLFNLDWSPDGKRLLTSGFGVKVWDTATGEMVGAPMAGENFARWSADGRFIVTRTDDNRARVWDAATTEPVTPFLPHSDYIPWVCITSSNRLITASSTNLLRAWDLKPTALPVEVIADYAKLLSGRQLNAGGVLLPIPAKRLAELAQSLRARAPQLFE